MTGRHGRETGGDNDDGQVFDVDGLGAEQVAQGWQVDSGELQQQRAGDGE